MRVALVSGRNRSVGSVAEPRQPSSQGEHSAALANFTIGYVPFNPHALRCELPKTPTARQVDVLAAFVAASGSVSDAAARVGVRPSTAKRHLADLRARSGLTTDS